MGIRPQTLYGIEDSPVGLAAWMLDHDVAQLRADRARLRRTARWALARRRPRQCHPLLADEHRDLAARLYWESHLGFFDVKGVDIPVGVTVFPDELYPAPRSWAEKAYPKLIHFNRRRPWRPFRRLGAARAALEGGACRLPIAALTRNASVTARSFNVRVRQAGTADGAPTGPSVHASRRRRARAPTPPGGRPSLTR